MKINIKIVGQTDQGIYTTETETGEYLKIGKYEFCLIQSEDKAIFKAVELSTGMLAAHIACARTKAPKQALIAELEKLATDEDKMKKGLADAMQGIKDQREELQAVINSMPTFPVNQPVKQTEETPVENNQK